MANDNSKSGQTQEDPNAALRDLLMQGVAQGKASDGEFALKRQKLAADTQHAAKKLSMEEMFKRQQIIMQNETKAHQVKRQAAAKQAAAKGQQPSPQEVVSNTMAGTETKTFRPQAPTSTMPNDPGGEGSMQAILAQVQGGAGAQGPGTPAGAVQALPRGASADQALSAAMPSQPPQQQQQPQPQPQAGGQVRMGGQTLTTPPELVSRINELGARPVQGRGGWSMAPTFSSRTERRPNVLTAGQVAELNMRQQAQVAELAWKLHQDSDGASYKETLDAASQQYLEGDPTAMELLSLKYPSLGRSAAKADISYRREAAQAQRATTAYMAQLANKTAAETAILQLQTNGALGAANWDAFLNLGVGPLDQKNSLYARMDPKDIYNENEGSWDTPMFLRYQKVAAATEGVLYYKDERGGVFGVGKEGGGMGVVSLRELTTNLLAATDGRASPAQREAAIIALDSLPFIDVSVGENGIPIITPEGDNSSAALITKTLATRVVDMRIGKVDPLPWMIDPLAEAQLREVRQRELMPAPAAPAPAAPAVPPGPRAKTLGEFIGRAGEVAERGILGEDLAKRGRESRRESRPPVRPIAPPRPFGPSSEK